MNARRRVILLTGASGFVGRHILNRLSLRDDLKVRALTRSRLDAPRGCETIQGDLQQPSDWAWALADVDVVVNTAGSIADPSSYLETNLRCVSTLLDLCSQHSVRSFVQMSSAGTIATTEGRCDESSGRAAIGRYEQSKLLAEFAVESWARRDSARRAVILQPTIVYGEGRARFVSAIHRLSQSPLPVVIGRQAVANIVHVSDVATATEVALNETATGRFLVANPVNLSILIRELSSSSGAARKPLHLPRPVGLAAVDLVDLVLRRAAPGLDLGRRARALYSTARLESTLLQHSTGWHPRQRHAEAIAALFDERSRSTQANGGWPVS